MQQKSQLLIIGLGTFKRPKMLEETLKSFIDLSIPLNINVKLYVVDNDPENTAKTVVDLFAPKLSIETIYFTEERRGIVYMRNKIMEKALETGADLLAFIDDDEEVENNWLEVMMENKIKYQANVIVGRVERILPTDTPNWVIKGRFFERPNIKTGTVRIAASTSNVIFDLDLIANKMGLRFHPALNLSGSSDTFLFTEATKNGAKIIWVNDNLIKESIPTSRMTINWLLKRAFRHTNCRTLRKRIKNPYYKVLISESLYGLSHFILGIAFFPFYIFLGKAGIVHSLRFFWKGAGSFAGLSGYVYKEYETIHGS
ncbi:MAG: succinoglycan biosynthesis protein ExoM [Cyclobacteriaceae bacterium]|jgi:succinoglycan biosynthesis protein ExoM